MVRCACITAVKRLRLLAASPATRLFSGLSPSLLFPSQTKPMKYFSLFSSQFFLAFLRFEKSLILSTLPRFSPMWVEAPQNEAGVSAGSAVDFQWTSLTCADEAVDTYQCLHGPFLFRPPLCVSKSALKIHPISILSPQRRSQRSIKEESSFQHENSLASGKYEGQHSQSWDLEFENVGDGKYWKEGAERLNV